MKPESSLVTFLKRDWFGEHNPSMTALVYLQLSLRTNELSTKQQKLRLVQIETICRQQNKYDRKSEICFGKDIKHCGKRRKCWLPAFSSFPTMFSKGFSPRVVKSRDYVVKS